MRDDNDRGGEGDGGGSPELHAKRTLGGGVNGINRVSGVEKCLAGSYSAAFMEDGADGGRRTIGRIGRRVAEPVEAARGSREARRTRDMGGCEGREGDGV